MLRIEKTRYLSILMSLPSEDIKSSFLNPTPYMDKKHLALHRIAYKLKTGDKLK